MANRALIRSTAVVESFVLSIDTSLGTGNTFTLPLPSGQTYDFWWNPGDGSADRHVTAYNDATATYDYGVDFSGQISIGLNAGDKCGGWSFANGGDKLKVTSVDQWGDVGFDYLSGAFRGCTNLINLTSHITGAENVSDFSLMFFGCTSFTELPELLFSECINATKFTQTFRACINLTTIPSNIFINCSQTLDISNIFHTCSYLVTIPSNLFDPFVNVTDMSGLFPNCIRLENIPTDLFRYCTSVTSFASTFFQCTSLRVIPANLFYYNALVTNYSATFQACKNIVLPGSIFNQSNLSIVASFANFMSATSTSFSNTGTIQDIWNYATGATSTDAFLNQTALTNYASIPNAWKGL